MKHSCARFVCPLAWLYSRTQIPSLAWHRQSPLEIRHISNKLIASKQASLKIGHTSGTCSSFCWSIRGGRKIGAAKKFHWKSRGGQRGTRQILPGCRTRAGPCAPCTYEGKYCLSTSTHLWTAYYLRPDAWSVSRVATTHMVRFLSPRPSRYIHPHGKNHSCGSLSTYRL